MDAATLGIRGAFTAIGPEVALVLGACVMFLIPVLLPASARGQRSLIRHLYPSVSLLLVFIAACVWLRMGRHHVDIVTTSGLFRHDGFAWFVKGIGLVTGVLLIVIGWNQVGADRSAEYHACLLLIVAGIDLVGSANDLISLFLALELISIPTYLLLYLPGNERNVQEATVKYFLLSVFSSAFLLYGLSFLYGITGETNLELIRAALREGTPAPMAGLSLVALAMIVAGLGFRVAAVPFHFYAPDVFAGAPLVGSTMLVFVPKVAGFVALLRLVPTTLLVDNIAGEPATLLVHAMPLLATIAVLTMFFGNIVALLQDNLLRLLAYSSIAHAGYMMVGVTVGHSAGPVTGLEAVLFYLVAYGAMSLGFFAILVHLGRQERPITKISDLAGLGVTHPGSALILAALLFSLIGLPPTAGFWGKLYIVLAAWSEGTTWVKGLAILLSINAAIAAWYYLRIIGVLYLSKPTESTFTEGQASNRSIATGEWPAFGAGVLCSLVTVWLFLSPGRLWKAVEHARDVSQVVATKAAPTSDIQVTQADSQRPAERLQK